MDSHLGGLCLIRSLCSRSRFYPFSENSKEQLHRYDRNGNILFFYLNKAEYEYGRRFVLKGEIQNVSMMGRYMVKM